MALFSLVSSTLSQLWSTNIKWRIPEINHSYFKLHSGLSSTVAAYSSLFHPTQNKTHSLVQCTHSVYPTSCNHSALIMSLSGSHGVSVFPITSPWFSFIMAPKTQESFRYLPKGSLEVFPSGESARVLGLRKEKKSSAKVTCSCRESKPTHDILKKEQEISAGFVVPYCRHCGLCAGKKWLGNMCIVVGKAVQTQGSVLLVVSDIPRSLRPHPHGSGGCCIPWWDYTLSRLSIFLMWTFGLSPVFSVPCVFTAGIFCWYILFHTPFFHPQDTCAGVYRAQWLADLLVSGFQRTFLYAWFIFIFFSS